MSYDLFFRPLYRRIERASAFTAYFRDRPHYKLEAGPGVVPRTKIRASIVYQLQGAEEQEEGEAFPAALNVNYFRPSYFGLEAEPEVGDAATTQ